MIVKKAYLKKNVIREVQPRSVVNVDKTLYIIRRR